MAMGPIESFRAQNMILSSYSLLITCYLLLVICYLLSVTCYLLLVTCYLLPVTCYLLLVTCYLFPITLSKKPGSGSYRFRFIPVPVRTGSRLTEPGSTVPGKVHKFHAPPPPPQPSNIVFFIGWAQQQRSEIVRP